MPCARRAGPGPSPHSQLEGLGERRPVPTSKPVPRGPLACGSPVLCPTSVLLLRERVRGHCPGPREEGHEDPSIQNCRAGRGGRNERWTLGRSAVQVAAFNERRLNTEAAAPGPQPQAPPARRTSSLRRLCPSGSRFHPQGPLGWAFSTVPSPPRNKHLLSPGPDGLRHDWCYQNWGPGVQTIGQ